MIRNILNSILVAHLCFSFSQVYGQYKSVDLVYNLDNEQSIVPGRFFNTDSIINTAAISSVSGKTIGRVSTPNLFNTLSGHLPGFHNILGDGSTGNDASSSFVRGIGSYGLGSSSSMKVFVDGFEVPREYLSFLSTAEIGSVSVLKDAASLATFGMNGANGILWIETKRGEVGDFKTTVRVRSGFDQPINIYKPLRSKEFSNLYNQAVSNDAGEWSPFYSQGQLELYELGLAPDVDWYEEVLNEQSPAYYNLDINFNGGSELGRYSLVFGYFNQNGLYNVSNSDSTSNQNMERFNLRGNLEFDLFDFLEAKVDIGGRLEERGQPNFGSISNYLTSYPSNIYPIHDDLVTDSDKNYSGTAVYPNNPVGQLLGRGWLSTNIRTFQTNIKLKENLDLITKGLYLQEDFSFYARTIGNYNKTGDYARYFNGERTTTNLNSPLTASSFNAGGYEQMLQGSFGAGYDREMNNHRLHSFVNFRASEYLSDGYFNYNNHDINLSGRVNYSYDDRYVGEFGFSYFSSDAYAPGNRWGFYPAVSGAWIISNEDLFKDNSVLDFLKLRGSVGLTGEKRTHATGSIGFDSRGRFLYQQYYSGSPVFYTGLTAPFDSKSSSGPLFVANENIFAEKSLKYNVGVDFGFAEKLEVTADIFLDKRSDIITENRSLMGYYGRNIFLDNIGEMTSKGIDLGTSFTDEFSGITYSFTGILSYSHNTIDYMAEVIPKYSYNAATGRAYGTRLGLQAIGFYDIDDFDSDGNLNANLPLPMFGAVSPGDLRYEDLDGNGVIDETDYTKVGKPQYPDFVYSFGMQLAFKGVDFSVLFQGAAGASINLLNHSQFVPFVNNANAYNNALDAWAYYPDQNIDTRSYASFPRLTTESNNNNYRASSLWIIDNNYLRIKSLQIGYDLVEHIIKSTDRISQLRIHLDAFNLLTFSKALEEYNIDPESGYGYPAIKTFDFGLSVTF